MSESNFRRPNVGAVDSAGVVPGNSRNLQEDLMKAKQTFPRAAKFDAVQPQFGFPTGNGQNTESYQPLDAVYDVPDAEKERIAFKERVKASRVFDAPQDGSQNVQWTVSDRDIAVLKEMDEKAQLKQYHDWILKQYDPRHPGIFQFLSEMEPDLMKRQMDTLRQQFELERRIKELKAFGPMRKGDLRLKYLLDSGMLRDPRGQTGGYLPGFLNPKRRQTKSSSLWNLFGAPDPNDAIPRNIGQFGINDAAPVSSGPTGYLPGGQGGPGPEFFTR